jgi:hypothetical protein
MSKHVGCLLGSLVVAIGCSGDAVPEVAEVATPLEGSNGIGQNGLSTNGIWQNGIWQNGIWQNGIWQNGIWQNGIWQNGIWQNGLWLGNPEGADLLRSNPYAAQLLQYVYACAMPPGTTATLDPFGGSQACSSDDDCGLGFGCSATNTCVIPLVGAIGVGVNADGSEWADANGYCDESCQRWVSACVLARTNAYGVKVDISMRAPDTAPQKIRDRLAVTADELADYPLREGAYYGNLFQTTPLLPEPDNSLVENSPEFFACGGPGSNIPQITKRFCSSLGDDGPITAVGLCEAELGEPGACIGLDDEGAERGCYTSTDSPLQTPERFYAEVLTVYLKQPLAVCGNAVCEDGENTASCPSDCHPGTWARNLPGLAVAASAVAPDGRVVVIGHVASDSFGFDAVTVDNQVSPPVTLGTEPESRGQWLLATYAADGSYLEAFLSGAFMGGLGTELRRLAVAQDGAIYVLTDTNPFGSPGESKLHLMRFEADLSFTWELYLQGDPAIADLAISSGGDVFLASRYDGIDPPWLEYYDPEQHDPEQDGELPVMFDPATPGGYVVKISATGTVQWTNQLGTTDAYGVIVDASGDPRAVTTGPSPGAPPAPAILALDGATGSVVWNHPLPSGVTRIGAIAADATGNHYATGSVAGPVDFGAGVRIDASAGSSFVVKLSAARLAQWAHAAPSSAGQAIGFDPGGNVISSGLFDQPLDLGAGLFMPYKTADAYLIGQAASDGRTLWAKQVPFILDGRINPITISPTGAAVTSGEFAGSMTVDSRLLVTDSPGVNIRTNAFVASFEPPCTTPGCDPNPPVMGHIPSAIVLEATSAVGAEGWYMLPTAIDAEARGTNVACSPAPNTVFAIRTATTVTCTATDPVGNQSTASFTITVRDTRPPVITGVPPAGLVAQATSAAGAVVAFAPTAVDQIDGPRPVSCLPTSGSTFPVGRTDVTCSATDASGNRTDATFPVTVLAPDDTTPPVLTVPTTITATATTMAGAVVVYEVSASDDVDGEVAVTCSRPSGAAFALGTTQVVCTARDAAGNTATASFEVTVSVAWSGILQPINANGSSVFKLGRVVPVKFALTGDSAAITNASPTLTLTKIMTAVIGSELEATSVAAADTGNVFRYDAATGQYVYNLDTKPLSVGTWRLTIDLHDGVTRTAIISLAR